MMDMIYLVTGHSFQFFFALLLMFNSLFLFKLN